MRWGYWILRAGAQVLFVTLFRGRIFGLRHVPRSGGVILVSNHQSFLDPILATLAGIVMLVKLAHQANAYLSMVVTLLGIVMSVKLVHQANASYPMLVNDNSINDLYRDVFGAMFGPRNRTASGSAPAPVFQLHNVPAALFYHKPRPEA